MFLIRRGDKGPHVKFLQDILKKAGYLKIKETTQNFGEKTETAVEKLQEENSLTIDGIVGREVITFLKIDESFLGSIARKPKNKYKGVTIEGSVFPDSPIKNNLNIVLSNEMRKEYLPTLEKVLKGESEGLKFLCTIMAHKEGFYKGSRSYRTHNPGNIGNTDSGLNKKIETLEEGILAQKNYFLKVISGKHKAYPLNKPKYIPPFLSPEIRDNQKTYNLDPYLPGYRFIFTGQIDQFVKIYSTMARATNGYLSGIISYYNQKGLEINEKSKLQDIIKLTLLKK